jgi:hypothetical protein
MTRTLLITLALVLASFGATAQRRVITVWGVGEETCRSAFADERSEREVARWIDGYLSGSRRSGHPQLTGYLAAEVREVCKRNPGLTVAPALREALRRAR